MFWGYCFWSLQSFVYLFKVGNQDTPLEQLLKPSDTIIDYHCFTTHKNCEPPVLSSV